MEKTGTVETDETIALTQDIVTDVACATLVDILVGDDTDGRSGLLAGKGAVGTYIYGLVLICHRVHDVLLRHCWQAHACKQ